MQPPKQLMRKQDFLERVIRHFIPPPILYVCEAEESGWFADIGRVAVIFVNIAIKGLPSMDVMQSVFLVSSSVTQFFPRSLLFCRMIYLDCMAFNIVYYTWYTGKTHYIYR